MTRLHRTAARAAAALLLGVTAARADDLLRLDDGWPARWNRIGPVESGVIGALVLGAVIVELGPSAPSVPHWDSPILFDDAARNALRAGSASARSAAATVSDFGYLGLPVYAIGVEAGLMTWLGKDQADAAVQLALIHAEALAINAFASRLVQKSVGRARPDAQPGTTDNTAFFSGHTSTAFTTASVLCVQHAKLAIYRNVADQIVCPASLTIAATTGLMRIVSDRHWASDVIAGAIFGTLVGGGVALTHFRDTGKPGTTLSLGADGRSLSYSGRF
jgi:membrane-associated phospholipid phosphatase